MIHPARLIPFLLLSACATEKPQTPPMPPAAKALSGEQILRESQGMAALAQRFKEGEARVQQGEQLVEKGNQQVAEGRRLINEGRQMIQEAEKGYGNIKQ
jgi:uncharacterized phage infection (PIP) family protein YhgE